ncbi:thiol reductant ABC exporter subunit CydD [Actinomadura madurae]|uniref:thiol reductant ABC exporter subunit CydD n=1 Tax=Actinomadura madurae TaxID=1993 RepID=UPI0020D23356|nr:thiol reductant ABC exporter subunit CydD [Actinomadura madurae]MCP9947722.1 thiol reductant ABC exporter subunit CydD [Actinomadura madurae]MCP9964488.1 thiol reductant ABC exporter subunit CydD [Actinomadura madurae]MCQ0011535.1 thiol reductant ABC exporter subunit CydD [Actinomadura madurae]
MKKVERRLLGLLPRRVVAALGVLAAGQGVLLVVQAELLVRAVAGVDAGPLPWLAGAVAGRAVLAWAAARMAGGAAAGVKRGLREGLLRGRPGEEGRAGARVTLLTRGLDAVDPFFTGYVPQLLAACVVPVVVLARLASVDWASALVVAVTVPLVPVFGALVGVRTAALTGRQWGLLHRLGGHFRDVLAGLGTLRAFGRTGHQSVVVRELAGEHRRASVRALRVAFLSSLVLELVCALSVAVVAVPVGLRLLEGGMALRAGLLVLVLTPEVYLPLRALGQRFHASAEGVAAAEAAFAALDARPGAAAGGAVPGRGAPEIVLEEVTVRYPGAGRAALEGVSLRIAAGERVAVTGPSGAGKSTLLLVLAGLVAPDSGRVLVDGVDLAELDVAAWRSRLGWVPQRPHLFAASVADNIRLADPGAGTGRVAGAARAAAVDFVDDLPDGWDTVLGEGGAGLSAGQRQRLAIARAFLSGGPVMLLDEPTARLDLHSERVLVDAAVRLLAGRTAVLVAHRPALLRAADRVVRLEGGRVVPRVSEEAA